MGCVRALCNLWSPQCIFCSNHTGLHSRRSCPLCDKQSSWRICEKRDIKWSVSNQFLHQPIVSPSLQRGERHGTLTIFSSTLTKNYPIPSHRLTQHVLH